MMVMKKRLDPHRARSVRVMRRIREKEEEGEEEEISV
jgi:hypothetical protein